MNLQVECTRFRVKPGKTKQVDEWLAFLNHYMEDTLLTLAAENMFVETIFRETIADVEYLYWYSVQGPNGIDVNQSDSWIDKKHLSYWAECIDDTYKPVDLTTEVVMIPSNIRQHMK